MLGTAAVSPAAPPHGQGLPPDFRLLLQSELMRRCRLNPKYSLRAYAKSLGVDSSTLSKILRGKRPLGGISIRRLGDKLNLSPAEIDRFIGLARGKGRKGERNAEHVPQFDQFEQDTFEALQDWYHFAILELTHVRDFRPDPKWIARALNISVSEVNASLERLERLGMLERTPEGRMVERSTGMLSTLGTTRTSVALRRLQKEMLQQAILAVDNVSIDLRDNTSMTIAVDPSRLPAAKERIKKFRRELATFLTSGPECTEVYQVCFALFPVTDLQPKTEN